jgi:hypothetical protein
MEQTKKGKSFTYPVTATWKENDIERNYATQLYQTGVYIIFNNNSASQGNMTPQKMVSLAKRLKKDAKDSKITDLSFGSEITVSDETGFWEKAQSKEEISISQKVDSLLKIGNTVNVTDNYRKIPYQWTIIAMDNGKNSITFTSTPQLVGLEKQVITDGINNTCQLSAFRATIQSQL